METMGWKPHQPQCRWLVGCWGNCIIQDHFVVVVSEPKLFTSVLHKPVCCTRLKHVCCSSVCVSYTAAVGMGNHTDHISVLPWRAVTIATLYGSYRHSETVSIGENPLHWNHQSECCNGCCFRANQVSNKKPCFIPSMEVKHTQASGLPPDHLLRTGWNTVSLLHWTR